MNKKIIFNKKILVIQFEHESCEKVQYENGKTNVAVEKDLQWIFMTKAIKLDAFFLEKLQKNITK